jgi:hypothetical protein
MGQIKTAFDKAFRDYAVDGVAASGKQYPDKSDARAIADTIEAADAALSDRIDDATGDIDDLQAAVALGGTNHTYASTTAAQADSDLADNAFYNVAPSAFGGAIDVYKKVDSSSSTFIGTITSIAQLDEHLDYGPTDITTDPTDANVGYTYASDSPVGKKGNILEWRLNVNQAGTYTLVLFTLSDSAAANVQTHEVTLEKGVQKYTGWKPAVTGTEYFGIYSATGHSFYNLGDQGSGKVTHFCVGLVADDTIIEASDPGAVLMASVRVGPLVDSWAGAIQKTAKTAALITNPLLEDIQVLDFGDSISLGEGLTDKPADRFMGLLEVALGFNATTYAVNGAQVADMQPSIYSQSIGVTTKSFLSNGVNDFRNYFGLLDNSLLYPVWSQQWLAAAAYLGLFDDFAKFGASSNFVTTSGNWSVESPYTIGLGSATNGETLTCTLLGRWVLVAYTRKKGSAGAASITIDDVNVASISCAPPAEFTTINEQDFGSSLFVYDTGRFGPHTVVVEVTSATDTANKVFIDWFAGVSEVPTNIDGPLVMAKNATRLSADGYSTYGGSDAKFALGNKIMSRCAGFLAEIGINISLADVFSRVDPDSQLQSDGVHPTASGHISIAQAEQDEMNLQFMSRDRTRARLTNRSPEVGQIADTSGAVILTPLVSDPVQYVSGSLTGDLTVSLDTAGNNAGIKAGFEFEVIVNPTFNSHAVTVNGKAFTVAGSIKFRWVPFVGWVTAAYSATL